MLDGLVKRVDLAQPGTLNYVSHSTKIIQAHSHHHLHRFPGTILCEAVKVCLDSFSRSYPISGTVLQTGPELPICFSAAFCRPQRQHVFPNEWMFVRRHYMQ